MSDRPAFDDAHVTILADHYHRYGGLKWNIDRLAERLVSDGCTVTVVGFDGESREVFDDGVKEVVRVPSPRLFPPSVTHLNYKVYSEMRRLEARTDVFHVINTFAAAGAGIYKFLGGETPVISTLNNWGLICPSYRLEIGDPFTKHGPVERAICTFREADTPLEKIGSIPYSQYFVLERTFFGKQLDRYAAVSDYVKRVYVANGFPEERIEPIGNHLDRSFLAAAEEYGHPDRSWTGELDVLYVGRLTDNKGVPQLLDATERVEGPLTVKIAGVGPLQDDVEAAAAAREDVEYLGFVDRETLPEQYFESHLFVHPATRPDPFPKTILESLQCDLPILCADTGPVPEIAGNACLTFEAGSVDALAWSIDNLLEDRRALCRMSGQCAEERAPYSFESVYRNLAPLYSELLSERERRASATIED